MPIPANHTFATATVVSSFPYTDSQEVSSGGTTYSAFYKITPNEDGVLGVWGFGDLTTYTPGFTVWESDQSTVWMELDSAAVERGKPFIVPVVAGDTYYVEFWPNAGNPTPANLAVSIERFANRPIQRGDFITNREVDRDTEFPLTVLSGTESHTVRAFVQIAPPANVRGTDGLPHGSRGAILNNGNILFVEEGQTPDYFKVFDKTFALLNTVTLSGGYSGVASVNASQRFYAMDGSTLREFDATGAATGTTWASITNAHNLIGVNSNSTILYSADSGGGAIKRWDLGSNSALSDLAAAYSGATSVTTTDILVLGDDSIVVCYLAYVSPKHHVVVKRWNASGTLLNTYDFGDGSAEGYPDWRDALRPPRIGRAVDDPDSFWITLAPNAVSPSYSNFQLSLFRNISVSDGSLIGSELVHINYLFGIYIGDRTATPESRYGAEKTFPLLVMPVSSTQLHPGDPSDPCCGEVAQAQKASAKGQLASSTGSILSAVNPLTWTPACTGGGTVPTASDATDSESWVS